MIRQASEKDIKRIAEIYEAIHDREEAGLTTIGWTRGVYPTEETARTAVQRGDMFVCEVDETDGRIVAAVINQIQVPEYVNCDWENDAPDEAVMVLHTLVVDPAAQGGGYGDSFVRFYEEYAAEQGCPYLRMDTNARNARARAFYAKRGYAEPGIVDCIFNGIPGVKLVCLEKRLV